MRYLYPIIGLATIQVPTSGHYKSGQVVAYKAARPLNKVLYSKRGLTVTDLVRSKSF